VRESEVPVFLYTFLDIGFTLFHTGLIFFNLFAWLWRKTRLANFITLALTAASWFALGLVYGIGYCPLTDWHWQIKRKLGQSDLPYSYLKWLLDAALGTDIPPVWADAMALAGLAVAVTGSITLNYLDWRNGKTH